MANFLQVDNINYSGKEAQEIFSKQVYATDIRNIGITLMDNVKGKQKIYTGEIGDVWQAYTCPFTPSGEATLAEALIEPTRIKVNMENCYDAFDNTYFVEQTKITLDGGIPQTFSDWFFNEKLLPKMAKEYQDLLWKGDKDNSSAKPYLQVVDGVEKLLLEGDAKVITASKFTVDNILSQVEAVVEQGIDLANAEEVDTENYKIFMNYADVKLLEVALGKQVGVNLTNAVFNNYAKSGESIIVMGYEVVPTMQNRSTVIFGPSKNIVLGFDTFDSHLQYKLIDMRESTGDNMFRVLAESNIAVGILFPQLFVIAR